MFIKVYQPLLTPCVHNSNGVNNFEIKMKYNYIIKPKQKKKNILIPYITVFIYMLAWLYIYSWLIEWRL